MELKIFKLLKTRGPRNLMETHGRLLRGGGGGKNLCFEHPAHESLLKLASCFHHGWLGEVRQRVG